MKSWIQQKGLIPFFLIGFGLWFLWDGLVGYPRSNQRWDEHERLKDKSGEWEKVCLAKGWKTEPPHRRFEQKDIIGQYVFAGLTGAIGIFSLIYWLRARRSVHGEAEVADGGFAVVADADGGAETSVHIAMIWFGGSSRGWT